MTHAESTYSINQLAAARHRHKHVLSRISGRVRRVHAQLNGCIFAGSGIAVAQRKDEGGQGRSKGTGSRSAHGQRQTQRRVGPGDVYMLCQWHVVFEAGERVPIAFDKAGRGQLAKGKGCVAAAVQAAAAEAAIVNIMHASGC
jgi:hypothetical protein